MTALPTVFAPPETLRRLPTPARPRVDPADVVVPDGYDVDVVGVGLSMPTGMGFADDGTLYVLEGGSTWPTRPYLPARILRLDPAGGLAVIGEELLGGPRGVAVHGGHVYIAEKGGYHSRIVRGAGATLLAKAREIGAHVEGLAGGLHGGAWRRLRELALSNLDSMTAFAITEQLGLALGMPRVVDLVEPVIGRKSQHQLVLRECLLEMAPKAILYGP